MAKYPYFGVPPSRQPRPAANEPALIGKRVILSTPEGFVYDMRAASEMRTRRCRESDRRHPEREALLRRLLNGAAHEPVAWPAHLVWIDC